MQINATRAVLDVRYREDTGRDLLALSQARDLYDQKRLARMEALFEPKKKNGRDREREERMAGCSQL